MPRVDPLKHKPAGAHQSNYADWLDEQDARRPPTRAELERATDRAAAEAVAAGGGIEAIIEATGLRARENVLTLIDPAILEQARRNDGAQASTAESAPRDRPLLPRPALLVAKEPKGDRGACAAQAGE